jgi:hypothetical protein
LVQPSWTLFIHDKNEVVPAYALVSQMHQIKVMHSTVARVGFKGTKYTFLTREEVPCVDDVYYSTQQVSKTEQCEFVITVN